MSDPVSPHAISPIESSSNPQNNRNGVVGWKSVLTLADLTRKAKEQAIDKVASLQKNREKIKLIREILLQLKSEATSEGLNLKDSEIQEKLGIIRDLGLEFDFKLDKENYSLEETNALKDTLKDIENILMSEDQAETPKLQMLLQHIERWISLTNSIIKSLEQTNKSHIKRI